MTRIRQQNVLFHECHWSLYAYQHILYKMYLLNIQITALISFSENGQRSLDHPGKEVKICSHKKKKKSQTKNWRCPFLQKCFYYHSSRGYSFLWQIPTITLFHHKAQRFQYVLHKLHSQWICTCAPIWCTQKGQN